MSTSIRYEVIPDGTGKFSVFRYSTDGTIGSWYCEWSEEQRDDKQWKRGFVAASEVGRQADRGNQRIYQFASRGSASALIRRDRAKTESRGDVVTS